ncbi:omega-hydroxypalmitate O-feruloyl transferase [Carex littledalei]|uniref:Omega-hydroxypalmitate O-feruloyl transferase n=1 Tax=Carex littledalei TaxID=544730 RepID=A0A833QWL4_9POAL|nr:omega-hydroxypalmitate O-feruloyl transferase [Carex littledalei]
MGSLDQTPTSLLQDLKVTAINKTAISPKEKKERRWMFLSNIDKVLNFDVETVTFFQTTTRLSREEVISKLSSAIESVLGMYDFQAGRLGVNPADCRLAIDCNASGVKFCVAESDLTLEELGNLEYPNPAFRQLVAEKNGYEVAELGDAPLTTFQVTWFKCGGFALGICNNHVTFDGLSFRTFLCNIAAMAADRPLAFLPCNDRHLLAARSPPQVTFEHAELMPLPPDSTSLFDMLAPDLRRYHLFHLAPDTISDLKSRCQKETKKKNPTSFNVVLSSDALCEQGKDHIYTVAFAMDIRRRLNPPLPNEYAGNAILTAYASASLVELETAPFGLLVDRVHEGAEKMTDAYVRSVVDWGETNIGVPHGDVLISSWWKLGFDDVEYPWGKPIYSCPVADPKRDIVLLLPSIKFDKGVNCLIPLKDDCVEKFKQLFTNT